MRYATVTLCISRMSLKNGNSLHCEENHNSLHPIIVYDLRFGKNYSGVSDGVISARGGNAFGIYPIVPFTSSNKQT